MVVKVKTSIYVDKDLWEKFKSSASRNGLEISKMLEEIIRDELVEYFIEQAVARIRDSESYEIDFEPIAPEEGLVSELVRVMRDERTDSIY